MIHIDFDPSNLQGTDKEQWETWQKRADRAVKRAIGAWKKSQDPSKIKLTNAVWRDLNQWLRVYVFHNKCAYCETSNPQYWPDCEHYRPKKGVDTKLPGATVATPVQVTDQAGKLIPHPGYFWLAFDWRNLIPACRNCNSGLADPGKLNRFDVKQQHTFLARLTPAQKAALKEEPYPSQLAPDLYFLGTADLDDIEGPLLLHPYRDRPEEHLSFEPGGVLVGTSPEGVDTIDCCNLRYEDLRLARQAAQEDCARKFGVAYLAKLGSHPASIHSAWKEAWNDLQDVMAGTAAYSAAVKAYVRRAYPEPL